MTLRDLADLLGVSYSTALRTVQEWDAAPDKTRVPAVTVANPVGRGRPGYRLDTDQVQRWRRGELRAAT